MCTHVSIIKKGKEEGKGARRFKATHQRTVHCQHKAQWDRSIFEFKSHINYRGFPTYAVFTTADPTIAVFGLCTCKWGIFALVGAPYGLQSY